MCRLGPGLSVSWPVSFSLLKKWDSYLKFKKNYFLSFRDLSSATFTLLHRKVHKKGDKTRHYSITSNHPHSSLLTFLCFCHHVPVNIDYLSIKHYEMDGNKLLLNATTARDRGRWRFTGVIVSLGHGTLLLFLRVSVTDVHVLVNLFVYFFVVDCIRL